MRDVVSVAGLCCVLLCSCAAGPRGGAGIAGGGSGALGSVESGEDGASMSLLVAALIESPGDVAAFRAVAEGARAYIEAHELWRWDVSAPGMLGEAAERREGAAEAAVRAREMLDWPPGDGLPNVSGIGLPERVRARPYFEFPLVHERVREGDWAGVVALTSAALEVYPDWNLLRHRAVARLWLGEYREAADDLAVSLAMVCDEALRSGEEADPFVSFRLWQGGRDERVAWMLAQGERAPGADVPADLRGVVHEGWQMVLLREAIGAGDWDRATEVACGGVHVRGVWSCFTRHAGQAYGEELRAAAEAEYAVTEVRPKLVALGGLLRMLGEVGR